MILIQNLLFTDGNPFQAPSMDKLADYILRDINDGSVYHDAYLHYIQVPGTDILVPIIFYIDKTHVDQQGCLCLEPVSFTLGTFKKLGTFHSRGAALVALSTKAMSRYLIRPRRPRTTISYYHSSFLL